MAGWTIFYWAWWVSWAPFVGMFVARISRGRTIREFVIGVVAAPTGFGFLWFAVVGGTGIELQRGGKADIVGSLATPELSLFTALDALPATRAQLGLCVLLIALFFISGADAASVVMATMASRGSLTPSKVVIVVLGVLMGGIACAMLLVGGLAALQQAAVLGSVPFTFVLVGVAYCWIKALREETRDTGPRPDEPAHATLDVTTQAKAAHVRGRARPAASGLECRRWWRWRPWPARAATANSERGASQQPQGASLRVTIGTQEFPEARILGELWRQALAVNGYAVNLRKGVGPAEDLDQALRDGEIDGYVAYTGTVLSIVAGEEVSGLDPDETYEQARAYYDEPQDMAMSADDALPEQGRHRHHRVLRRRERPQPPSPTCGKLDDFVLGARPEFESLYLGLEGLQQVYGLTNATFAPFDARASSTPRSTTATPTPSTRSRPTRSCESGEYALLDDPELLFGSQNVVMVVERGQARLDRRRRLPARGRRGQRRARRGRHGRG